MALTAANAVLSPAAQRIRTQEHTVELRRQHGAALLLFLPVVAIAIAGAGFVIPAIDGGRYPESPAVFRILAISSLLSFAMSPALNLVLRYEDFRFLTVAAATACVLGPVLNLLLIPRFGAMGTAWSLLVSMSALNGAGFWRASRYRIGLGLAVAA
jgi:O-antigen/teichoic acid export membrane protein